METRDLIIIGGGAAGLTAAQYAARANLKVLLVEEMSLGGQGLLIDRLENYPGLTEAVDGFEFFQNLEAQARNFGAEILSTRVNSLKKEGKTFVLETGKGIFGAEAVVIATGAKHRQLGVPGEGEFSGRGVSYCATCDGPFFKGQKILVVGGGDSACSEAMFLAKLSDKIVMIHRKETFRAQKALAQEVLDNPAIEVRFLTTVREILGAEKVEGVLLNNLKTGETYREDFSAVFIFVGSLPQTDLVPDVPKDAGGFIVTDENRATSLPGLYAAGDVRATPFRQIVTAAADGAIAAHCASEYIDSIRGRAYV